MRERHEYICTEYKTGRQLPARWTEKYREVYKFGKKQIIKLSQDANRKAIKYMGHPVKIDKDGNNAVRSLINKEFGYTVSQGQASLFQSYKISHIWGEAYDPRKFTNLWNLVLVPAWANDLLDKTFSGDELTVTFKQMIKQICIQFYGMKTLDWGDDFMEMPSWQEEHEADLLEKYNGKVFGIKWIEARKSKPLGEIKTKKITIKI